MVKPYPGSSLLEGLCSCHCLWRAGIEFSSQGEVDARLEEVGPNQIDDLCIKFRDVSRNAGRVDEVTWFWQQVLRNACSCDVGFLCQKTRRVQTPEKGVKPCSDEEQNRHEKNDNSF